MTQPDRKSQRRRRPTVAELDAIANDVLPAAMDLICQVRDWNAAEVREILTPFTPAALRALAVVLAAMVPDDQTLNDLIEWTHDPDIKVCSRCREPKHRSDFHQNRSYPGGLHYWCRDCHNGTRRASAPAELPERVAS